MQEAYLWAGFIYLLSLTAADSQSQSFNTAIQRLFMLRDRYWFHLNADLNGEEGKYLGNL